MVLEIGTVLEVIGFTLDVFEKWDEHKARWMTAEDEKAARWATVEVERERSRILGGGFAAIGGQVQEVLRVLRRQEQWSREALRASGALLMAVRGEVERVGAAVQAQAAREKQEVFKTVLAEWGMADMLAADGGQAAMSQLLYAQSRLVGEATRLCSKADLSAGRSDVVVDCGLFATGCMARARGTQDVEGIARQVLSEGAEKLKIVCAAMVRGQTLYEVGMVRWAALARVIELRRELLRAAGETVPGEPWQDGLADLRRTLLVEGVTGSAAGQGGQGTPGRGQPGQALPLMIVRDWVSYVDYNNKYSDHAESGAVRVMGTRMSGSAGTPADLPDRAAALMQGGGQVQEEWERRIQQELGEPVRLERPAVLATAAVLATVLARGADGGTDGGAGGADGGGARASPPRPGLVLREVGYQMVEITPLPGGFWMGSPEAEEGRDQDERLHFVRLTRQYAMGDAPVTQKLYQRVMGANPSHFKGDSLPVEQVSWDMAVEFCNCLSALEGLRRCYAPNVAGILQCDFSANGYRLPTEAEWEYAARANHGYRYAGGNNMEEVGWYNENSDDKAHIVKQKKKNGFGLYDMSGNIWEWCWDFYGEYPASTVAQPALNPSGAAAGVYRVNRGGGWLSDPEYARVSMRGRLAPGYIYFGSGFRIVRSLS